MGQLKKALRELADMVACLAYEAENSDVEERAMGLWRTLSAQTVLEELRTAAMGTNLQICLEFLGWQGGTIHQVAKEFDVTPEYILTCPDIEGWLGDVHD